MAKVQDLTTSTFEQTVSSGKVLVDFWAAWCGPCRMQSPVIDKLAQEMTDVTFTKVNVDEEPKLAQQYGVMSIPSLLIFNDGKLEKTFVGVQSEDKLKDALR